MRFKNVAAVPIIIGECLYHKGSAYSIWNNDWGSVYSIWNNDWGVHIPYGIMTGEWKFWGVEIPCYTGRKADREKS